MWKVQKFEDYQQMRRFFRERDHVQPSTVGPDPGPGYSMTLREARFGAITVGYADISARHPWSGEMVSSDKSDVFLLVQPLIGFHHVVQREREALLRPGRLALLDATMPCRRQTSSYGPFQILFTAVPRSALGLRTGRVTDRLTAAELPTDDGLGSLTAFYLRRLLRQADDLRPATAERLGSSCLDLITSYVGDLLYEHPEAGDGLADALVMRAQSYAESHLGDRDLSPATLAAAVHVSVRYLHKLFADRRLTVAGWIRHRRLERCRLDLSDPVQAQWSITEIAHRWGFTDSAHFSRAFKAAYGITPRDQRLSAHAPPG
ncbi:helix-turn-helix domain-containing protein [Streptomyces sp. B1866]|uniref:helix-turn-helix domain-containing protein n=1 Tax=Streptomyces sp. B1866 TaxID=3075431 RepID=UPI00288C9002|nr:helix-turn-helix domain-containing protein [Streptomyces sp. B1866]MDT3399394.1 helix-turn-helix domain-containing protein [Streptomyces sp. B1866]